MRRHTGRVRRRSNRRRGATAVEFAIVAPVFFLVMLAMIEFARLNVLRNTADNAAYEAARVAMVPGATTAQATAEAQRLLNVVGARGARITLDPPTITSATESITVSIDLPLDQNGWVFPRFTASRTLSSQATLRTERVRTR